MFVAVQYCEFVKIDRILDTCIKNQHSAIIFSQVARNSF